MALRAEGVGDHRQERHAPDAARLRARDFPTLPIPPTNEDHAFTFIDVFPPEGRELAPAEAGRDVKDAAACVAAAPYP